MRGEIKMAASVVEKEVDDNRNTSSFSVTESRDELSKCLDSLNDDDEELKALGECYSQLSGSDVDKRAALDQVFREILRSVIERNGENGEFTSLIQKSVIAAKQEFCGPSCPFILLSDLFNSIPLERCDDVFTYVESGVEDWKSDVFYTVGKNYLLRMCNDLLRRLSKSLNTVFCGRIQLFLARLFPLSEKSGLNLMSQFNFENVTKYDLKDDELFFKPSGSVLDDAERSKDESMEVEEGEMEDNPSSIRVDYNMYRKFWSLQNYFRAPHNCYDKVLWKKFTSDSTDVLTAFASCKLDDMKVSRKRLDRNRKTGEYAAKYLTSSKLLDLQLNDSNFRRYVLVQFLVLFQYLNASVKFRASESNLKDDQTAWITEKTDEIYQLLRETPTDGDQFAKYIEHVLEREEHWNSWKNEGCQSFVREKYTEEQKPRYGRAKKRAIGDDMRASAGKLVKMGNPELTKLWNLSPDNLAACTAVERVFLPDSRLFFEDAVEQADPANQIEDEYKDFLRPNWQWRALRLLSRQNPTFFSPTNTPGRPLQEYFQTMLAKMGKEKPHREMRDVPLSSNAEQEGHAPIDERDEPEPEREDMDIKTTHEEELQALSMMFTAKFDEDLPSVEQIDKLSLKLLHHWRALATELNFTEEDVEQIEAEGGTEDEMALRLLFKWQDDNLEAATLTVLRGALKEVGLVTISKQILGDDDDPKS